jgi:hypothetical protein
VSSRRLANAFSVSTRWQKPWMVVMVARSKACSASVRRARCGRVQAPATLGRVPRARSRRDPQQPGDGGAHAAHQLGRGLVGERDDQDLLEARVAADDAVDDQVLEQVGLAGARRRLDDRRGAARDAQQLLGERDQRGGAARAHRRPSSIRASNSAPNRRVTAASASASGSTG